MNRGRQYIRHFGLGLLLLALALPALAQAPVTFQYAYDAAGRLAEVMDSAGNSLLYTYDAAGNIRSITRQVGEQAVILSVTDSGGKTVSILVPGQTITINGIGLGDCPNVTVTVDGIPATIVSQTATSVTIVVPQGITVGQIVVTSCHGTATITIPASAVLVSPAQLVLIEGQSYTFTAMVLPPTVSQAVTWSVDGGTITQGGVFTAPATPQTVHVIATSTALPSQYGEAIVTVVSSDNAGILLSPGVTVGFGSNPGTVRTQPQPVFLVSPGVTVQLGSNPGTVATQTQPIFLVSPGVTVQVGGNPGTVTTQTQPVYLLSPGVTVQLGANPGTVATETQPVYLLSPGVSVQFGNNPGTVTMQTQPVYLLSPGVTVQLGNNPGTVVMQTQPVEVLSGGVTVGFGTNPGTAATQAQPILLLSPGISVQFGKAVGQAAGAVGTRLALRPGATATVTLSGARLDQARALAVVDAAGQPDPAVRVLSVAARDRGRALDVRLSVSPQAKPGPRRFVVWAPGRKGTLP